MKSFIEFEGRLREFFRDSAAHDFEGLARELFALQFTHNPPYRKFCEAEGRTLDRVANWTEIPAVPTTAFKELELTSIPAVQRRAVFCSSGTTGQRPSRHFHNANSLAVYEASLREWGQKHLPMTVGSLIFLTPPGSAAPHSSLAHMFETMQRDHADARSSFVGQVDAQGGWQVNIARVITLLTVCQSSGEAVGLLGTAFNFVHLLDALRERKARFQLPRGSWVLETGGYKGRSRSLSKSELHGLICDRLGIDPERIACEYGMSELSSQAYDLSLVEKRSTPRIFQFPPWARVRIVSPEDGREVEEGEIGLIRVCDLANVYSVMAIETQDLGMRRGSGFELIGRAERAEARGCSLMARE